MDDVREYLSMLRRRWEIPFWCITICLGIAVYIAYTTPPVYRSTGTIMVESAEIPLDTRQPVARGAIDQHLDLVRRRVLSDENTQLLVDKHGLFPELSEGQRRSALMSNVNLEQINPITLEPLIGGSAFNVHFNYAEPEKAQAVAQNLVDLFLEDNRRARTQSAAETEGFFAGQAERLARAVVDAEARLAAFKQQNQGLMPEDIRLNQSALDRAERELNAIQAQIRVVSERRNLLNVQLDALSADSELATLKAELALARQRYTEDHPNIRRLVRTIAAMEGAETPLDQNDPEYRRVQTQMQAVEMELSALRDREQQLRGEIGNLSDRLVLAPEVEKQLQELDREHQMLTAEYREMRQRRGQAEIASNLQAEDKGERYTQIRPARVPSTPFSPNRVGIILLGVMLALAGSAGLVALREGADESVRSSRDIVEALNGPPIATIPVIRNDSDKWLRYRRLSAHGAVWLVFVSFTFGAVFYG